MISVGQMLKSKAREKGTPLEILEKDYALSYLLAAVAKTPGMGNQIVLKGGTALRKLYYPSYRFSEDLDYSTIHLGPLSDCDQAMTLASQKMTELLQQNGPFILQLEPLLLPQPHPEQQAAYTVRVQFPYHRQPLCRLKVEITTDEPILLPIIDRQVLHEFDEPLVATVSVYDLREIVAEKLRTLLQVRRKLAERGWGASRVCRDYYDLWSILQQEGQFGGQIPELLSQKCKIRQVTFKDPTDFISPDLFDVARKQWSQLLLPFVPNAPHAERVLLEVQPLISALWD
jgi:predicted nucleotidyltransferase component of viral defense system